MKITVSSSFLKSLKSLNSLTNKFHSMIYWFRIHLNKWNRRLMKTAFRSKPWDYYFLYELEKVKLEEMISYFEKSNSYVGIEEDIRYMKICVSLIDIFTEKRDLFHFTGDFKYNPIAGTEDYELDSSGVEYHCDVYVNTRNRSRFVDERSEEFYVKTPHELYIQKAKALYHKIRYEKDGSCPG